MFQSSNILPFFPLQTCTPHCCCSVTKSCPTSSNPMNCSKLGFPVLHYLPAFAQTHAHWVGDTSNHLILCRPLLLLSIFPSIRVFFNELAFHIRDRSSASVLSVNIQGCIPDLTLRFYIFRDLVLALGILQTLSWSTWDLVPWPGNEMRPLHWEHGVLATATLGSCPLPPPFSFDGLGVFYWLTLPHHYSKLMTLLQSLPEK